MGGWGPLGLTLQHRHEIFGQDDILQIDCLGKQRGHIAGREASNAAADPGYQEHLLGARLCIGHKLIHIGFNSLHATVHRGNGVALSLHTNTLSLHGTKLHTRHAGSPTTVGPARLEPNTKISFSSKRVIIGGVNRLLYIPFWLYE